MTRRTKANAIALVILASCAREAAVHDVPASPPSVAAIPSGNASSTVSRATDSSHQAADSIIGDADDESLPPIDDSTAFSCSPKSFGPRDTLTFRMETPHGDYLTVLTPADVFYYFVYPQPAAPTRQYSIVPSEAFKTMSTLKVPGDVRLPPRIYGKDTIPEVVFSQPGQYIVKMGENLESDYTGRPYICRLTFIR